MDDRYHNPRLAKHHYKIGPPRVFTPSCMKILPSTTCPIYKLVSALAPTKTYPPAIFWALLLRMRLPIWWWRYTVLAWVPLPVRSIGPWDWNLPITWSLIMLTAFSHKIQLSVYGVTILSPQNNFKFSPIKVQSRDLHPWVGLQSKCTLTTRGFRSGTRRSSL